MSMLRNLASGAVIVAFAACSAGGSDTPATIAPPGSDGGPGLDSSAGDVLLTPDAPDDQSVGPDTGCATSVAEAKRAPAALLIVLDKSQSMADGNKWVSAAQAVVQAIDQAAFDDLSIGLYAAPTNTLITGPACIMGIKVACQAPAFPQIEIKLAGAEKSSDPAGVRHDIKAFLSAVGPTMGMGDASPMYAGLQAALGALQGWNESGKRILLLVTDGTLSCNQLSNPARPGFSDCNGCDHDWEDPLNIIDLLAKANADPQKPVESFVVGVPGADTYDAKGCNFPPYHMRLALSAMANAGAPSVVDPSCTGKTFTKDGTDPSLSCHIDMTQGNFNAQALADVISDIRGKTLGCTFDLPKPETGEIDKSRVNVQVSLGGVSTDLLKRADVTDTCETDGCWDYDAEGRVQLIGKVCSDVKNATDAKVQIVVGCSTKVK